MSEAANTTQTLITRILACRSANRRCLVGIAGAPGSGKSTLAENVAQQLAKIGAQVRVVPMDGFHLDNRILKDRDLLERKGAPETFDFGGFQRLIQALANDTDVYYPEFDRSRDIAIAGRAHVGPECSIVLVEGNYLLLDEPGWRDLAALWDVSIRLQEPLETLRARLINRWLAHGLDPAAAQARAEGNDLTNATRIQNAALPADLEIRTDS
ncbi:nucleoside triphosphate hydrolase [Sedimentitalea todarodis]|uniref:Nucleoside triphosphate hydrolase n=1 Tax=Sedimentitalea todarodis TaxID=1631240 RepID=A0ABU3VB83_9RHOB|nr:nucleoside triphosphate hydrolase [Sedimentitalea todarodis]MDU9003424.1 nucleoside triphosphate hydrolase [Sedimentitalea todarodis]